MHMFLKGYDYLHYKEIHSKLLPEVLDEATASSNWNRLDWSAHFLSGYRELQVLENNWIIMSTKMRVVAFEENDADYSKLFSKVKQNTANVLKIAVVTFFFLSWIYHFPRLAYIWNTADLEKRAIWSNLLLNSVGTQRLSKLEHVALLFTKALKVAQYSRKVYTQLWPWRPTVQSQPSIHSHFFFTEFSLTY